MQVNGRVLILVAAIMSATSAYADTQTVPFSQPFTDNYRVAVDGTYANIRNTRHEQEISLVAQAGSAMSPDDRSERARREILEGLQWAQELYDSRRQELSNTPELQRAREAYLRGYGAAPHQVIRQAGDMIDPDRTMPAAERNLRAIGLAWRFFMDRGDYEKARETAASMVQAYNMELHRFHSVTDGLSGTTELDTQAKAGILSYANIRNASDLSIESGESGNFILLVIDHDTGQQILQELRHPREIAATEMHFSIDTFHEDLLFAAGIEESPQLSNSR